MPFIDKAFKAIEGHPERLLRKALSYNLVDPNNQLKNVLGLGGLGAATGAGVGLSNDNATLKSVLTDAGIGAGVGGIGGRFLPRVLQKGIGRVMTNLMDPVDYAVKPHLDRLKGKSFKELLNAVVKDKPITGDMIGEAKGRSHHFRKFFGLEPLPGTSEYFVPGIKPGEFTMNPLNADASVDLATIAGNRVAPFRGKPQFAATNKPQFMETGHMGGFHVNPDGSYKDTWDFALHPHEKIDSLKNLFRAAITPFGNPVSTVGKTLSEAGAHSKASLMDDVIAKIERARAEIKEFDLASKTGIKKVVNSPAQTGIVDSAKNPVKSTDPRVIFNQAGKPVSAGDRATFVDADYKPYNTDTVTDIKDVKGNTVNKNVMGRFVDQNGDPLFKAANYTKLAREAKASNADAGMIKAATPASLIAWKRLLFGNHVKPQLPLPLFQDVIQSGGVQETDTTAKQASFGALGKLLSSGVGGSVSHVLDLYRKFHLKEAAVKLPW